MRLDKDEAVKLRKTGKSYKEIKEELGIPKSTLSDWFKNTGWSQRLAENLAREAEKKNKLRIVNLNRIKGNKLTRLYKDARKEAKNDFKILKHHPLFVSGIMLYWGEGDKSESGPVRIANVDPGIIRIFYSFLEKICGIEKSKIRSYLLLYPDLNEKECKEYWVKNTNLKLENFTKSVTFCTFMCYISIGCANLRKVLILINYFVY